MAVSAASRSVGLEIDSGMVRAVEAAGSPGATRLINMAGAPVPDGAVEEGIIMQPEEVGMALSKLWSRGPIKSRSVMLGISNQSVLVRYATIPKVPPDKLANVIRFHAQEHLPIPLESVVLDHMVVGETVIEDNTVLEVLLVAARRDMLQSFLEALEVAKLEPADIDVSTLTLMRVLPEAALKRAIAVVNVANGLSNILISVQGSPRMARLVSVKLKDLADGFNCALKDVVQVSAENIPEHQAIYSAWTSNLINETRSSITYYQNQENAHELEAILINGRGALLKGIAAEMQQALGLPVRVINPFTGFVNGEQKTRGSGIKAVEFAICAGLARRGLEG